jgi:hypothetical protein
MEKILGKKTLQRIIGLVIIATVAVVLIPFFFNKQIVISPSSTQSDTAKLTVPAVSDQPMAAAPVTSPEMSFSTNTEAQNANSLPPGNSVDGSMNSAAPTTAITRTPATVLDTPPQTVASSAEAGQPIPQQTAPAPITQPQANVKYSGETGKVMPAPAANANSPILSRSTSEIAPVIPADINKRSDLASNKRNMASNVMQIKNNLTTDTAAQVKPGLKIAKRGRDLSFGNAHHIANHLSLPKRSAWVVQMGSFKNKSNAHRLVSRLKASGFKAFIHETQSSTGSIRTAVYVGPESREASAAKLSTIMSKKIHMHGFIVPYKPMVF